MTIWLVITTLNLAGILNIFYFSVTFDIVNNVGMLLILIFSIRRIEIVTSQFREPGFFAKEKLMRLHTALFVSVIVFYMPGAIIYQIFVK